MVGTHVVAAEGLHGVALLGDSETALVALEAVRLDLGVKLLPLLCEAVLLGQALNFLGIDLVVDKIALVPRLCVGDVCAEDDAIKGGGGTCALVRCVD